MVVFAGWLCLAISVIDKVEIGLDQKLSMPQVNHLLSLSLLALFSLRYTHSSNCGGCQSTRHMWRVDFFILHSSWRVDHTVVTSWLAAFTFVIGLCYRHSVCRLSVCRLFTIQLLCLVVIFCRGTARRPHYKYSVTARLVLVFCFSALLVW